MRPGARIRAISRLLLCASIGVATWALIAGLAAFRDAPPAPTCDEIYEGLNCEIAGEIDPDACRKGPEPRGARSWTVAIEVDGSCQVREGRASGVGSGGVQ